MTIATFFAAVDFNDTLATPTPWVPVDPVEQMAQADNADWTLLRLVLCSAAATLVLALACSLNA